MSFKDCGNLQLKQNWDILQKQH